MGPMTHKNKLNQLRARMIAWGDINKRDVKQGPIDEDKDFIPGGAYLLPEYWVKDFTYATRIYNSVVKDGRPCSAQNMRHCNKLYEFYLKPDIAKDYGNTARYNKDTFDRVNQELNTMKYSVEEKINHGRN